MGLGPLPERARRRAGDVLDGGADDRFVQRAVHVEVEEGVDVFDRHLLAHLGAGLVVGLGLEPQVASQNLSQYGDLLGREERFGAGRVVDLPFVAVLQERLGGDGGDVAGVDDGGTDVRERQPERVAGAELREPAKCIGHEG